VQKLNCYLHQRVWRINFIIIIEQETVNSYGAVWSYALAPKRRKILPKIAMESLLL